RPDRVHDTVAAVNLDMVGESQSDCGSTFLLEQSPHFLGSFADELLARIRSAAQDWVRDFSGAGHYSLARLAEVPYSGGSDHALWLDPSAGVPCPMLIQWPDRYYHSNLDTPERCDPDSLALAARAARGARSRAAPRTRGRDPGGHDRTRPRLVRVRRRARRGRHRGDDRAGGLAGAAGSARGVVRPRRRAGLHRVAGLTAGFAAFA